MLKKVLERGALIVVLPIITLFISAMLFGVYGTYLAIEIVVKALSKPEYLEVTSLATKFFSVVDVYLLAIVLYIFAIGLYELFIGELQVADWIQIHSIDQLKAKLASLITLFVAIAFTKQLVEWQNPVETLLFGAATGILTLVLIQYYKAKEAH
ncbi:MAG: YqhA family protein [Thermoflexales bacterium]|nr:YqhA family protein [Thermoflexales bacterium]